MRTELFRMAADLTQKGEAFALAFVVRRLPASSSREGDMAIITADGTFHGWLGGSCTQPTVVAEVERALADGRPRLLALSPQPEREQRPGVVVAPMTCFSGGSVEIYIEPVLPSPRLVIFGGSPIAQATGTLGRALGYAVLAEHEATAPSQAPLFAVVATMGDDDEASVRRAFALAPAYVGVVASAKRGTQLRETLAASGVAAEALASLRCPAGLRLGAQTPEEIALSILAEIVECRRKLPVGLQPTATPTEASPTEALDPICGMTVNISRAKHVAEHAGKSYYFCCGGCKEKFLAAPEKYLASAGQGA